MTSGKPFQLSSNEQTHYIMRRLGMCVLLVFSILFIFASFSICAEESDNNNRTSSPDELTFLGILSESMLTQTAIAQDARLVRIRTADTADTVPVLSANKEQMGDQAESEQKKAESAAENRYFVCRLNRLPEKERLLLDDAADGDWDRFTFLEAVMIAEGTPELKRRNALRLFERLAGELRQELTGIDSEMDRAKAVFEFLHRRVLTGPYELNRTSASASLATGYYNCVSATVLYNAFAAEAGLTANGLETIGHVKSRLLLTDGTFDIETTCTDWGLLPDRLIPYTQTVTAARPLSENTLLENTLLEESVLTGESTVPNPEDLVQPSENGPVRYSKQPVREVSPVEFVATIYYNRGVDYYQKKRFGPAISAYLKALEIDPENKTVLGNLKATLNNLAIELAMQKKFAEAIQLTEQGLAVDPDFQQFQANLPLYYQLWSKILRDSGRTAEADELDRRYPKSEAASISEVSADAD